MNKQLQLIKKRVLPILLKNNVKKAGIFGSYVKDAQKKNSDIDILVDIKDKKMTLLGFIHIKNELEKVLGKKVDLVEYKLVRPEIKDTVLKEEVRIL